MVKVIMKISNSSLAVQNNSDIANDNFNLILVYGFNLKTIMIVSTYIIQLY